MEKKVVAVLEKLQELSEKDASEEEVYYYAKKLCLELQEKVSEKEKSYSSAKVSVTLPDFITKFAVPKKKENEPVVKKPEVVEKIEESVEDSALVEADEQHESVEEPAAVAAESYASNDSSSQFSLWEEPSENDAVHSQKPSENNGSYDKTQTAEQELSWNDRLKEEKIELGSRLGEKPVKKLSQAIGVNDKFTFIKELFREDNILYARSLKTIDKCKNLNEAMYWINRELKIKLGWQDDNKIVQEFYHLVKKRFP